MGWVGNLVSTEVSHALLAADFCCSICGQGTRSEVEAKLSLPLGLAIGV